MTTREFIDLAFNNEEICTKLLACNVPPEAYAVAQSYGLTDDLETFVEVMTEAHKKTVELTDFDLDNL